MPRRASSASRPTRCAGSNFIKPKAMPYTTPTGKIYDSGDFAGHHGARAGARRLGRLRQARGRVASAPASCAASASRPISRPAAITGRRRRRCTLERDGGVTVLIGSQSTGQGHATAYAQLVAEQLDLPPERVRVVQGDTDRDRDRRRHRRLELDPGRRRLGRPRGQEARRRSSRSSPPTRSRPRRAISKSPTARCASPAPTAWSRLPISPRIRAPSPSSSPRASEFGTEQPTYPERHAHRRGRDRSANRRDRDRRTTSSSTISAPRSIRCCWTARCTAAPCRASARR